MKPELAARLSRFLVSCYPPRWRQRYAAELLEVLDQHQPTAQTVVSLCAGAVSAQLDPAWRAGWPPGSGCVTWLRYSPSSERSCCCPPGAAFVGHD